ncbi:MAG TPA: glycine betaine ABC transporter substrate-binding protein, partial [Burkholderiales bacterium]|nr:glycine betaine ABC transporter substrate-binding protein [Burkholderiales bacterium]
MKSIKHGLCGLLAALLCFGSASHAHARYVALGHVDLSFYEVTANVVQLILERLGYNVGVQKGSHGQIYPLLARGEVDLFVAAWLPNAHASYWEQYQNSTTKVTALYDDARLFWSVPDYVPASEVKSVADLRKPEVAAKMQKEIRGPGADSGLMIGSKKIVEAYGLGDMGYRLAPGRPADWIANFNDNVAAKRWFVMPLWQPQYLNKAYKMRILEEPKQLLGG